MRDVVEALAVAGFWGLRWLDRLQAVDRVVDESCPVDSGARGLEANNPMRISSFCSKWLVRLPNSAHVRNIKDTALGG